MPGLCGRVALFLWLLFLYFTLGVHIMFLLCPEDVTDILSESTI